MEEIQKALEDIVGKENVTADKVDLICYSNDMSPYKYEPDFLVFPKNTEEISKILGFANERKIPVTPRGAGTSVVGAVLPRKRGIVLDLTKMDRIKEVKVEDMYAVVEPGVVLDDLNRTLARYGLFFPPDPGSSAACTIGGMANTNASGIRAAKYGTTKDWIYSMEVVLPDGKVIRTGKPVPKTSSGYNLVQLFAGSEGTLGVITELTLKIAPLPAYRATINAYFDSLESAGRAITDILVAGIKPAAMELMDKNCIGVINEVFKLGLSKAEGMIVAELDGHKASVQEEANKFMEICSKRGGRDLVWTDDPKKSAAIWGSRKALVPSLARLKPGYAIFNLFEDPGLPISSIGDAIKEYQKIAEKHGLMTVFFGHMADGNIHPVMIVDPSDAKQLEKALEMEKDLADVSFKYGGTITAEHGIGITKLPFAEREMGASLQVMSAIKKAIDPNNILNPGKMGLDTMEREETGNLLYQAMPKMKKEPYLEEYKNEVLKCFRCGFCRAVCPMFGQTKLEPSTGRGKALLSYFYLTGQIPPSNRLVDAYNYCTICMHCTVACPAGVKVFEIVQAARRNLAEKGYISPVHKAAGDNIMKFNNPFSEDAAPRKELAKSLGAA